jgi:hypothetical protein
MLATVSRAVRFTTSPPPPNASMRAFEQDRLQQNPQVPLRSKAQRI